AEAKGDSAAAGAAPPAAPPTGAEQEEQYRKRLAMKGEDAAADTEFHRFIHSPERLVVPSDEKGRQKAFKANPKLQALVAGKELVPVKAEDLGVEAVDDYTLRITMRQPAL